MSARCVEAFRRVAVAPQGHVVWCANQNHVPLRGYRYAGIRYAGIRRAQRRSVFGTVVPVLPALEPPTLPPP